MCHIWHISLGPITYFDFKFILGVGSFFWERGWGAHIEAVNVGVWVVKWVDVW